MDNAKIQNFIIESRKKGISDKEIFDFLDSKGAIPSSIQKPSQKEIAKQPEKEQAEQGGVKGVPGVVAGATKGVGSTIKGLGELGGKLLSPIEKGIDKLTGMTPEKKAAIEQSYGLSKGGDIFTPGSELNKKATELTTAKSGAERLGKTAEQVAEFFIPAGKVAQVEKVLASGATKGVTQKLIPILGEKGANLIGKAAELGTKVAVRAGEGAGVTAIQTGGDAKAIKQGALGGAIFAGLSPVISKLGIKPLNLVKNIGRRVAGGLTKGTKVIDSIIENPRAALEGLSGKSFDILSKNADEINTAVRGIQKTASRDYELALSSIDDAYKVLKINPNDPQYFFEISSKLSNAGDDILKNNNIEVVGGKLDFSGSPFVGSEESIINKAYKVFTTHDDFSARGLETLAQKLKKFQKDSPDFASANRVIQSMVSTARDAVQEKAKLAGLDDIADMTKKYAQAKDKIDLYEYLFNAVNKDKISPEEKTKIIKKIDDLFSGNKDIEMQALEDLGLSSVASREAGRVLQEDISRQVSSMGDVARTVVSTLIPPKTIGKIVANLSLGAENAQKVISAIEKMKPAARGAFIKAITGEE